MTQPQPLAGTDQATTALAIGIDVGGTKILGVVTGADGVIANRLMAPTPKEPERVPDGIAAVAVELRNRMVADGLEPAAVGVGVPGLVDHEGVLHYGPNVPGVVGLDIAGHLRGRLDLPAVADNDASLAAVAEHRLGAARGYEHAIIVTQGTGIGGGLIVNNALLHGANGFAGEPGHMLIDRFGPRCACGTQGCWEALASGAGLANLARQVIAEGRGARILELAGGDPGHVRGEHIAEALDERDPDALVVIDKFAWWVAQGLASLITLLDPGIVVLGGGLTALSDSFIPDVQDRVVDAVLGGAYRPVVPVVPAEFGAEAGAVGGSLLALDVVAAG
ncbi:MAG: ROK family protein [Acidimicrobiia bacterium]|nr:ROK family protein [Acidimicrobiia bacterium]